MKLAVIPARGGSKRIPRKNIKSFMGQPVIAYSVRAALDSGCFDRVIVSTDDPEIAEVARGCGAEIPFLRPASLSGDMVGTIDVISHATTEIARTGPAPSAVCCIYAAAPFITPDSLRKAQALIAPEDVAYSFPVAAFPSAIQRALQLSGNGAVGMFDASTRHTRSQDLVPAYYDAGQFYWGKAKAWLDHHDVYGPDSRALVLPAYRVQDIDTPDDWIAAELMYDALSRRDADLPS